MLLESLDNMAEENKLANMNSISLHSTNSDETASNSQKKVFEYFYSNYFFHYIK